MNWYNKGSNSKIEIINTIVDGSIFTKFLSGGAIELGKFSLWIQRVKRIAIA
ncbi:hypothetical protein [Calothrix sp. 336/3]|uniref:hypothetical protein n=1 Tax=Calothrix sp. 336/3 TaxID=1337936 RepID=UPI000A4AB201|nr:hypothetical protein [Calothrix sp. 336/3]